MTEQRTVIIDEVNISKGYVSAHDQYRTPIQLTINFSDPLIVVPAQGETWLAERRGSDWFLSKRSGFEHYSGLSPGDMALPATGRIYLSGDEVIINDVTYLRAISGRIQSDGVVLGGSMFTCSKGGTGQYVITYKFPFDQLPAISATKLSTASANQGYVSYSANATTATTFQVWNSAGTAVDSNFTFIAMRII